MHQNRDEQQLKSSIDIQNAWRKLMSDCRRQIISKNLNEFEVIDQGTLNDKGTLVFNLHSTYPFEIDGNRALLKTKSFTIEINFDYAVSVSMAENLINHDFKKVYHLKAQSAVSEAFDLCTTFKILK